MFPPDIPIPQPPANVHNQVLPPQPVGFQVIPAPQALALYLPPDIIHARDEDLLTFQLEARRISSVLISQLLDLENIIRDVDFIRGTRNEN